MPVLMVCMFSKTFIFKTSAGRILENSIKTHLLQQWIRVLCDGVFV